MPYVLRQGDAYPYLGRRNAVPPYRVLRRVGGEAFSIMAWATRSYSWSGFPEAMRVDTLSGKNDRGGKQKREIRVEPVTTPTDLATRHAQGSSSGHCSDCISWLISTGSVHHQLLWGRLSRQVASTAFWQYARYDYVVNDAGPHNRPDRGSAGQ
jgi:hypothetical protein